MNRSFLRHALRIAGWITASLIALCGLLIFALMTAGYFFTDSHLYLDWASHFLFQLFLALTLCGLLPGIPWILPRKRIYGGILAGYTLLIGLPAALMILPPFFLCRSGEKELDGQRTYSMVLLNARDLREERDDLRRYLEQRKDTDLIALTEYVSQSKRAAEVLNETHPYRFELPNIGHKGLALFSRVPAKFEVEFPSRDHMPVLRAGLTLPGNRKMTLFLARALSPKTKWRKEERNRMLNHLAERIRKEKTENPETPILLAGDLNASAFSPAVRSLQKESGLCSGVFPLKFTWPVTKRAVSPYWVQIDHCFGNDKIRFLSAEREIPLKSDHYPLFLRFQLND